MYGLVAGNVLRHVPLASIVEEILAIIFEEVSLFLFLAVLSEEAQTPLSSISANV